MLQNLKITQNNAHMPDSNCRACGCDLEIKSVCVFCRQPIRLVCNSCGSFTDEKYILNVKILNF